MTPFLNVCAYEAWNSEMHCIWSMHPKSGLDSFRNCGSFCLSCVEPLHGSGYWSHALFNPCSLYREQSLQWVSFSFILDLRSLFLFHWQNPSYTGVVGVTAAPHPASSTTTVNTDPPTLSPHERMYTLKWDREMVCLREIKASVYKMTVRSALKRRENTIGLTLLYQLGLEIKWILCSARLLPQRWRTWLKLTCLLVRVLWDCKVRIRIWDESLLRKTPLLTWWSGPIRMKRMKPPWGSLVQMLSFPDQPSFLSIYKTEAWDAYMEHDSSVNKHWASKKQLWKALFFLFKKSTPHKKVKCGCCIPTFPTFFVFS